MKDNLVKSFIRDTYQSSSSIIPYVITCQAIFFVILCIMELLVFAEITPVNIYSNVFHSLALQQSFTELIFQPWAFITHPLVYDRFWNLLFDSLWLYWLGQIFLNLLQNRQFNFIFIGGILIGAIGYLTTGFISSQNLFYTQWHTIAFGLGAVIGAILKLSPDFELRLLLIGNVKFKYIAAVYILFELIFYAVTNSIIAFIYPFPVLFGYIFLTQLQNGKDWSSLFNKRKKLKIVTTINNNINSTDNYYPNQQEIDQILDKISLKGYESLNSQEKEALFRASKKNN